MKVRSFTVAAAAFERSPGQEDEVYTANMVDERDGAPVTIGYGRWGPGSELTETMAVDDIMIVLEGELSVTSDGETHRAGPGGIVHMPKGERVTILAHAQGATTAYVTYPHWREAQG